MSKKKFYRKISVEGKIYEYKIGKNFTKVKGIGEIPNNLIGYIWNDEKTEVRPKHIKDYILTKRYSDV